MKRSTELNSHLLAEIIGSKAGIDSQGLNQDFLNWNSFRYSSEATLKNALESSVSEFITEQERFCFNGINPEVNPDDREKYLRNFRGFLIGEQSSVNLEKTSKLADLIQESETEPEEKLFREIDQIGEYLADSYTERGDSKTEHVHSQEKNFKFNELLGAIEPEESTLNVFSYGGSRRNRYSGVLCEADCVRGGKSPADKPGYLRRRFKAL